MERISCIASAFNNDTNYSSIASCLLCERRHKFICITLTPIMFFIRMISKSRFPMNCVQILTMSNLYIHPCNYYAEYCTEFLQFPLIFTSLKNGIFFSCNIEDVLIGAGNNGKSIFSSIRVLIASEVSFLNVVSNRGTCFCMVEYE